MIGQTVLLRNGNIGTIRAIWWNERTSQLLALMQRENMSLEIVDLSGGNIYSPKP
jgi:hypothetical protein